MVLRKLAISSFATRKARTLLTVLAIALSVSLVVSVTSGYASIEAAAMRFLGSFLQSHDIRISRRGDRAMQQSLADLIAQDPDVSSVLSRLEFQSTLLDKTGGPIPGRQAHLIGIQRPEDQRVESLPMHEGGWFNGDEGDVAVIDQVAARLINQQDPDNEAAPMIHVGDTIEVPGPAGRLRLKIVGITHKPQFFAAQVQTVYLPLRTLQKFIDPKNPNQATRFAVALKDGADDEAFAVRWKARLAAIDTALEIRTAGDSREKLNRNLQGLHALSYMGGTVSMLAATFIVFSALSMGVAERQRTLALLRAVGAFRGQLGALVIIEGILLAAMGIVVGTPLGWLWVKLISLNYPEMFTAGVVVGWGGVAFAAIGSLLAALVASFLPAWAAMRTSPLDAMTPLASPSRLRRSVLCAVAGFILISVDPILMFGPMAQGASALGFVDPRSVARSFVFYAHFALGLPCLMLGYFLLAPLFVRVVERLLAKPIAAMFGIRGALLKQQLSTGIWRAAGTAAALMVGLAVLVVMQTQGRSMLDGWKLPTRFPDVFITASPLAGLSKVQQEKLSRIPGIVPGDLMPIAIETPGMGRGLLGIAKIALIPDATMFFGVDPDQAFRMMELDFRAGNPTDAAAMLKKGRHLIVTEEFRQLKGLTVGDKLPLNTINHGVVDYTIAGVVWSPGLDVIVSTFDLGKSFDQRTAASVFGSLEDARKDFGSSGVYLFAANLVPGINKATVREQVRVAAGAMGMGVYDVRQVKFAITHTFNRLLLLVSSVAFAAMIVSALGVTNTIMASIRSRRWQFGILRSIGVTRGGLLRLVLAEALLLGLVGVALGLLAGLHMAVDARQFSALIVGYKPPTVVPWSILWIGVGVLMTISLLASLGPAIGAARSEPLTLLQSGRASS